LSEYTKRKSTLDPNHIYESSNVPYCDRCLKRESRRTAYVQFKNQQIRLDLCNRCVDECFWTESEIVKMIRRNGGFQLELFATGTKEK
jgi:hypothetical protein